MAEVKNYAEALYQSSTDPVATWQELRQLSGVISGTPLLKQLLLDASVAPVPERHKTIDGLLKNWTPLLRKFVAVIVSEAALPQLPAITEAYRQLLRTAGNVHEVVIETARPLKPAEQAALLGQVKLPGHVLVTESVKPELIGGARLIIDDVEHDFTLAGALDTLKQQLVT